jgi:hypothetical protein
MVNFGIKSLLSRNWRGICYTKNWYRKGTDLWAEFGKETPFNMKFSSKHSVKMPAVGSSPSFSRRAVLRLEEEAFGKTWMTWPEYKEGTNWWQVQDEHWRQAINLGNKCCTRGRLGVMLEKGYKYEPLVFVIGIEQFHNKPALCQPSSPLVESSSSSGGAIDPLTSVSTGNLVSCLVSCGGFRLWCK